MSRKKASYQPDQLFKLSRAKIELFCQCPCCFYLDRKLGFTPPSGPPFTLNSAVDELWKKEFDSYRIIAKPHPIMVEHGIDAIPFQHEKINDWRNNRRGVSFLHEPTQFLISGAVDEIWITPEDELIVVDVKATSKGGEINIDADWQMSYKRQMEIYQWLFRKNDFKVCNRGYFIYCNGKRDQGFFGNRLEFDISVIPYDGEDNWIEPKLREIHECLSSPNLPRSSDECQLCKYRLAVTTALSQSCYQV